MQHFTTVYDVNDPLQLINEALDLKSSPYSFSKLGRNKTLGLIFLNPSLRTRLSTQKAAKMLGMEVMIMNMDKESWAIEWNDDVVMNGSTVEHIKDAAAVLGSYCDIIGIRCFPSLTDQKIDYSEKILVQLMRYCNVPVVSLESATLHPLQSLTDAITIKENWNASHKPKVVLSWAPHIKALPQAVANSFAEWMTKIDVDLTITHPKGYELCEDFTKGATIEYDQEKALQDADFVYVKNWSSYNDYGKTPEVKENWMLDLEKYKLTNKAGIMHCLPVRRDVELSSKLIDHTNSLVQKQATNRVFAAQVVLKNMLTTLNAKADTKVEHLETENV
ncbi:MAG: acetylornithine carbamoyltransferase [Sphingobacteriaceae bacterium]|nr:acetylornithine carbamoyltransferase [Sphingobacteriaceae bacterium]